MKIATAPDCAPQVNQCTNPAVMEDEMADREVRTALQNRHFSAVIGNAKEMSHLLLLSAQHIPGKVIKINPWQHCAMVQCDVHCVWPSLPGFWRCFSPYCYYLHLTEQGLFSPHVTCCRKHHWPGDWHCGHGDTYWFWEPSCSPCLNVSDSSLTWLLEIHRWRAGSQHIEISMTQVKQ